MENLNVILTCCEKIENLRQKINNLYNEDYEDVMQRAEEICKVHNELEFEVAVLKAVIKLIDSKKV